MGIDCHTAVGTKTPGASGHDFAFGSLSSRRSHALAAVVALVVFAGVSFLYGEHGGASLFLAVLVLVSSLVWLGPSGDLTRRTVDTALSPVQYTSWNLGPKCVDCLPSRGHCTLWWVASVPCLAIYGSPWRGPGQVFWP
jgi:hypothetical protein